MSNQSYPRHRTRYGVTKPEFVLNDLRADAASRNWTGYHLRIHLRDELTSCVVRKNSWYSIYRESLPGPFWSWERFGRTSTALHDGRVIPVAGEHEDCYDPGLLHLQ